jgi:prophage regulatory protein
MKHKTKSPVASLPHADGPRLISKPEVLDRVGVSFPTVWKWMREGDFPRSRDLGGKTCWLASEIDEWILSRPVRKYKAAGDTVAAA